MEIHGNADEYLHPAEMKDIDESLYMDYCLCFGRAVNGLR